MAVAMRETWTDERLDDLRESMHREFDKVHREFDNVNGRIDSVNGRIDKVNGRIDKVNDRIDSVNRTIAVGYGSIVAAVLGAIVAHAL